MGKNKAWASFIAKCEAMEAQNRLDYAALCDRVEKIDAEAARWLRDDAPSVMKHNLGYCGDLAGCFFFDLTPQGKDFWDKIYDALKREVN